MAARLCGFFARVGRAATNPFCEQLRFFGIETLFWWHAQVGVVSAHGDDDSALIRFSRDDCWPRVSALSDGDARVEKEAAFSFACLSGVAFEAVFGQERANAFFEECDV
jgi:hypothetical protein